MRCEEYRNGVKISEVNRDYPFIVVSCTPAPLAMLPGPTVACYQDVVQFTHLSTNATSFHWDFGDAANTNDTSNLGSPQWTYANPGTYTVTLVVQPYTACADTATMVLTVQEVYADYIADDTMYTIVANQFTDSSWTSNGSPIVTWDWDFGDASTHSTLQNPTHVYSTIGTYTVTLIVLSADGCLDTTYFTVFVDLFNSIQTFDELPVKVYPNPSEGIFTISLLLPGEGYIRVKDLAGRELYIRSTSGESSIELSLDLAPGAYFVEYIVGEKRTIREIVIQ